VLAVFYTLYLTRALTLPIVLALLLSFLLRPLVRALGRAHVPIHLASGVVVLALLGGLATAGYLLSEPLAGWLQKSPQLVNQLERKLRPIKEKVQEVDKAAAQMEKITAPRQGGSPTVEVRTTSLRAYLWDRAEPLITGGMVMFFLLYFLLATGDRLIRRISELAATVEGHQRVIDIAHSVERNISRYLASVTLINAGLGICTAVLTYVLGMPNPLLWGALAMLLNYVPYLGAFVTLSILTLVALLTFDSTTYALLVPMSFLLLTSLEGQLITPLILGKRLALNPVVLFVGLIFWGWLWGPAGALLAVPLLMTLKIVGEHVPPLASASAILSR
jgi:predicted PurR-regulated permease PerM